MTKPNKIEGKKLITAKSIGVILTLMFLCGIPPLTLKADLPYEIPGSRAASLAYSTTSLTDGWSLFHNQAGLGFQEHAWVGVHHENRFITPELAFSALGGIIPLKPGALGVSIKRLGFSKFNQTKFGLAYGMKLAPTLSAGVQLNAHHLFFAGEYGSTTSFSAEGGIIYTPTQSFSIGAYVFNPTRSRLHEEERISTTLALGVSYQISPMVLVTAGAQQDINHPIDLKAGIEFIPINNLYLRGGFSSNPTLLSFGVGYKFSGFEIDLAFSRHEYLGYTPHFSLAYAFGQKLAKGSNHPTDP